MVFIILPECSLIPTHHRLPLRILKIVFMKVGILILCIFCLISCRNTKSSKGILKPYTKDDLLGSWSMTPGGKPAFTLDDKQIYFFEEEDDDVNKQSYSYRLGGDSIVMDLPNFSFSYKIQYMEGDSIRLITQGMQTSYFKLK